MASGEDIDSGMSSQNSKAVTPEKMPAIEGPEEDEVRSPVARLDMDYLGEIFSSIAGLKLIINLSLCPFFSSYLSGF